MSAIEGIIRFILIMRKRYRISVGWFMHKLISLSLFSNCFTCQKIIILLNWPFHLLITNDDKTNIHIILWKKRKWEITKRQISLSTISPVLFFIHERELEGFPNLEAVKLYYRIFPEIRIFTLFFAAFVEFAVLSLIV